MEKLRQPPDGHSFVGEQHWPPATLLVPACPKLWFSSFLLPHPGRFYLAYRLKASSNLQAFCSTLLMGQHDHMDAFNKEERPHCQQEKIQELEQQKSTEKNPYQAERSERWSKMKTRRVVLGKREKAKKQEGRLEGIVRSIQGNVNQAKLARLQMG